MPTPAPLRARLPARFTARALAAVCAALPLAAAQAQSPGTPTVVVTGTRLPLSAAGLAQNVTIIDRAEIEASHAARVEDLLARMPGAYVDQAGQSGGFVSMYMRGAENSHLLILLDGVKLNDPTTTRGSAYDLSSIDVSQIERIEVLRGPASAVYGGEALAGVVHIITKRAAAAGVSGSGYIAAGGDDHRKIGGSVAFGSESVQAQVGAGRSEEGSSEADSKLRLNTVIGFGAIHADRQVRAPSCSAVTSSATARPFPTTAAGPRLAVNRAKTLRDTTDSLFGGRFSYGDARTVRVDAVLSRYDRQERADNAAVDAGVRFPVPAFISDTDFQRSNATLSATHDYNDRASIVVGLEYQKEEGSLTSVGDFLFAGSPQTFSFQLDRKTTSAFVEGRMRLLPELAVQVGLRYDDVEGLDSETTPHLGLVWDLPNGATTLKANYNEGFKPPSFFALGFPIGGNPDLRARAQQEHRAGAGAQARRQRLAGAGERVPHRVRGPGRLRRHHVHQHQPRQGRGPGHRAGTALSADAQRGACRPMPRCSRSKSATADSRCATGPSGKPTCRPGSISTSATPCSAPCVTAATSSTARTPPATSRCRASRCSTRATRSGTGRRACCSRWTTCSTRTTSSSSASRHRAAAPASSCAPRSDAYRLR